MAVRVVAKNPLAVPTIGPPLPKPAAAAKPRLSIKAPAPQPARPGLVIHVHATPDQLGDLLASPTAPIAAAQKQASVRVKQADAALPSKPLLSIKAKPGSAIATKQGLVKALNQATRPPRLAVKSKPSLLDQAASAVTHAFHDVYPSAGKSGGGSIAAAQTPGSMLTINPGGGLIAKNALNDAVDIPANAIPALYHVGDQVIHGHITTAAHELAQPYVDLIHHPVQSFTQHPLGSALLFGGAESAVGRGLGRGVRVAGKLTGSQTLKDIGSTARAPKTVAGTRLAQERSYSPDLIHKGAQVAVDRARGSKATTMTSGDIKQRIDEEVQAAKNIAGVHASRAAKDAKNAISGPRVRLRVTKPSAAVTLAAQGVTTASKSDLQAYLSELEHAAPSLTGDELKANETTRQHITNALKNHDEHQVAAAAQRYAQHAQDLEQQVLAHGLVRPDVAEQTRLAPITVRRLGADPAARRAVLATAKQERDSAKRAADKTQRAVLQSDKQLQKAVANARVSVAKVRGVAPAQHDALLRAIEGKTQAKIARKQATVVRDAAAARRSALKATSFTTASGEAIPISAMRAAMPAGTPEPAFVSHATTGAHAGALPVERVTIPVKATRTGEAVRTGTLNASPDALVKQSVRSQGLIDAANARTRLIEQAGHREHPDAPVTAYKTQERAQNAATALHDQTGVRWAPVQHQGLELRANKNGKTVARSDWVLIPKAAHDQLTKHAEKSASVPLVKAFSAQWRRNVLALSPKWLTGNTVEAALRSMTAHAGPGSYITAKRALNRMAPVDREQAIARTVGGGQYATSQRVASAPAHDLGRLAQALHTFRNAPGARHLADAYGLYTHIVFHAVNGRLETQFQTAMLGKALRDHPLMSDHIVKISAQAADEAARGLTNTNTQAALGRAVDRMYGKYGKFNPGLRNAIGTYTPFLPWALNATNFLYHVLPADHPVLTALLASANETTTDWRTQHGDVMTFFGQNATPPWLQGGIPGKNRSVLRLSRFTPFGLLANDGGNPVSALANVLLPQFTDITNALAGKNWQGKNLTKTGTPDGARDILAAAMAFIEGQVPAATQALNVAGVHRPQMTDTQKVASGPDAQFNPFKYTASSPRKSAGTLDFTKAHTGAATATGGLDFTKANVGAGANAGGLDFSKAHP